MNDLVSQSIEIMPGVCVLPSFADSHRIKSGLDMILEAAPVRRMQTSRGFHMSVSTSNCGDLGWISDRKGYRYSATDPLTGSAWPEMPEYFSNLAQAAASLAGFSHFLPDACLINRYLPGTQMGAHQDRDESSFDHPIVSVSLGIEARFYMMGAERKGKSTAMDLTDGDVVVFGGAARNYYHGVRKIKPASHPLFGAVRWNLTFRKAG